MAVKQYAVTDITCTGKAYVKNPFTARIEGRFVGPRGHVLRILGFYDGENTWKIRFSPTIQGKWNYTIRSIDIPEADGVTGVVTCSGTNGNGGIIVSKKKRFHFEYEDGTPHFMNAYECDWLWAYDLGKDDLSRTESLIDLIKSYSFNTVIMNLYAHDSNWTSGITSEHDYGPPAMYAWEGTNENPDHTRLNVAFFSHFDAVMNLLAENGIAVHLFLKVYNKQVNWPEPLSPEDDLYFLYITARYQAYWNITWDFAKESKYEVNKDYLYDRIMFIKNHDAYRRMVTTHDDPAYFISERRAKSIDFFTAQQHHHFYDSAMLTKTRYGIPYFNSEFGYEHGPGGIDDVTYGVGQTPEEFIRRAYLVVMAGGFPAYYYTYTAWDVIDPSFVPPGMTYFKILYDFFTSISWSEFEPSLEFAHPNFAVCLAKNLDELLIFPSDARSRKHVFVTAEIDISDYEGEWMDIFSGDKIPLDISTVRTNGPSRTFVDIPFESGLGLLHLKKRT